MKNKFVFSKLVESNTLIFIFSIICSLVIWFTMAAENVFGLPRVIYDVPITINLSDAAQEAGVRVFSQDINKTSVSISGSTIITNNVSASDLQVSANLSPIIGNITGKTLIEEELVLSVTKNENSLSDYEILSLTPEVITVVYDKYKEQVFDITNELTYTSDTSYYVDKPVFSSTQVTISGPESSVKQVAKVSVVQNFDSHLTSSVEFSCSLTLYDSNNNILDPVDLYLTLDVETVDITINVSSKQTVDLITTNLNIPSDFSTSRIIISPSSIEIAGSSDIVSQYSTITLGTAIDFSKINLDSSVYEVSMEIPMPDNVQNVSNISTATVSINLNGYKETEVTVNNFNITNVPDGKSVEVVEKAITAIVISPTAQASTLNSDNVYATIDMAGKTDINGEIQATVKVYISGIDSAWVYGEYTINVNISDAEDTSE
ncbi:MAG: CdaR family protein [Clostridia bacterium]